MLVDDDWSEKEVEIVLVGRQYPHPFTADPDPNQGFHLNADPALNFNADPDPHPAPHQSDAAIGL